MKLAGLVGECSRFRTVKPFVKIGTWIEIESFPHGFAAPIAQRSRHETIQGTTISLATQATVTIHINLSQGKNLENNRVLLIILIVVRVGTCHSTLTERNSFFVSLCPFSSLFLILYHPGSTCWGIHASVKGDYIKGAKNFPPNPLLGWPLSFFYSSPFPPVRIACVAGATVGSTSSFLPSRARLRYFSLHPKKMARSTQATMRNMTLKRRI